MRSILGKGLLLLVMICVVLACFMAKASADTEDVTQADVLESPVPQEEVVVDSGEAPMECQDFYDEEGNLIWKGLTGEEYLNMTEEQKKAFREAMHRYDSEVSDITVHDELLVETSRSKAHERLMSVACEYNELIPYAVYGREWGLGYVKYEEGYNNTSYNWTGGFGLDGEGYLLWLVRQCFGYTPESLIDGIDTGKLSEVHEDSLQIGDIAVEETPEGVRYGMVVSLEYEYPAMTICDSTRTELFPCGCTHFVFDKGDYFGVYRPVSFTSYYRIPDVDWEV